MNERVHLFVIGVFILTALYFDLTTLIYVLCLWLLFEGLTGILLTQILQKFISVKEPIGLTIFQSQQRFNFEAIRATRIIIAIFLGSSLLLHYEYNVEFLWFFPWFMGFGILGAGASGICPIVLFTKWLGFK